MITKYGYLTVGVVIFICIVLVLVGLQFSNNIVKYSFIALSILLIIFTLNFFRDPERTSPNRDDIVVSPADGKVLFVKDVYDDKFVFGEAKQVSIFMSPLNVHVNRIPIDGTVKYLKYVEGDYIVAYEDKASEVNERSEIGIESKHGKVFFTQVAGYVARRIVYDLEMEQKVKMGERFGMIKFGSRSDVIVPKDWIVKVTKDQNVFAGETILFEIPK